VHTIKKDAETLVVVRKETGLKVNPDKTKYMAMSRDQSAGPSHSVRIENSSFEKVEEFKCSGTILADRNSIQEKIKSRWNSRNTCYHSVQNLLSSSMLSKILKIKITAI
jgi:hypothetical protein